MPWLVTKDEQAVDMPVRVLASAEVADVRSARRRGLLGRDGIVGRPSGGVSLGSMRLGVAGGRIA